MNAVIITIGDELLIGQVIDTNSSWIASELNKTGIAVTKRIAVGDNEEAIINALQDVPAADVVIITGGLGPTSDDITKPVLNKYFGGKIIVDEEALKNVKHIFEVVFKRPLLERNLKQAEVPDVCQVIQNTRGTAPGMVFEKKNTIFISMPGVPHEMKSMFQSGVIPLLKERFNIPVLQHRTLMTFGVGESFIAERLIDFEKALPANIKLAYLPHFGLLRLRLSSTSVENDSETEINIYFDQLKILVKEYLISEKDQTIQELIFNLLQSHNKTLCTAESCTGGYISHLLTLIPGISDYYKGTIVSYGYEVKEDVLKVKHETLLKEGAVSERTVKEMLIGAIDLLQTDVAIAVSGIMGPGGGTELKPVGTVWIAVGNKNDIVTRQFQFRYDRKINIEVTALNALNMLREFIAS